MASKGCGVAAARQRFDLRWGRCSAHGGVFFIGFFDLACMHAVSYFVATAAWRCGSLWVPPPCESSGSSLPVYARAAWRRFALFLFGAAAAWRRASTTPCVAWWGHGAAFWRHFDVFFSPLPGCVAMPFLYSQQLG
jgi:hypothetical protein